MNLENRGNGSWRVTISDGYNPDGSKRRFQRTIHVDPRKTENAQRREAEKQAALIEADYRRKLLLLGNKITVAQLAEEYLIDRVERRRLKISTINQYKETIYSRIVPELGKEFVQDLNARDINAFYRKLKNEPARSKRSKSGKLSGTTQRKYHTQLHAMLEYAVKMGYIAVNPCNQVDPPQKDTAETKWYELDEAGMFLRALDLLDDTQWRLYFYMAIYTGMRPSEMIALNWSDIQENVLFVKSSAAHIKGKGTIRQESPKTEKGYRRIVLPRIIVDLLACHRREQLEYRFPFGKNWPEPDAVFTTDDGRRMNISSPTHKFKKILKKYNLPELTLYGLRHTAATTLIAKGVSARDVAERMGHAQTSTTMNIYAHAFRDASEKATDVITDAFDQAKNG